MNEAKLFEQLFDDENPKESSKSNVNLLENLFDAPVACSAKNKKVKDKQNKDSVEHELIKLAEKKTHLVKKAT